MCSAHVFSSRYHGIPLFLCLLLPFQELFHTYNTVHVLVGLHAASFKEPRSLPGLYPDCSQSCCRYDLEPIDSLVMSDA